MLALSATVLSSCQTSRPAGSTSAQPTTSATTPAVIANPVLPGDFADPSVVKIGNTYWASATTSNWGPVFPLLKSRNLTDWELVGHVFPDKAPNWADYYFWAPEISEENGKTYVFYAAHQRGGNLAVGVASAPRPEGPYTDHGPLVGQPDGSIDAFPIRDENGQLYLIWKEDGNSIQQPTPIWAQPMNAERTALTGTKTELFRNTAPWEGNLVEGSSIVRHDGYFYMFYAGNGCCGRGCTYATGVARAKNLLGPWEKYEKNPILVKNDTWTCPGHGTAVNYNGRWFMLHHAYQTAGFENVGRQGVLSEFRWRADGWPEFIGNTTPATPVASADRRDVKDEFKAAALALNWQWPIEQKPQFQLQGGKLSLTARPDHAGAALGLQTAAPRYTATTTLLSATALPAGTDAGLAAIGDPDNTLALTAGSGKLRLWQRREGKDQVLSEMALPADAGELTLRVQVEGGNQYRFSWSPDAGKTWQNLPAAGAAAINGTFLPPWDRGVRVGVLARGPGSAAATFERFELDHQ